MRRWVEREYGIYCGQTGCESLERGWGILNNRNGFGKDQVMQETLREWATDQQSKVRTDSHDNIVIIISSTKYLLCSRHRSKATAITLANCLASK